MAKPPALQAVGRSIQGEQQVEIQDTLWATDDEVSEFVAGADDGILACRERGRHFFPPTRVSKMHFYRITREGRWERRVPCEVCRHVAPNGTPGEPRVVKVELWDIKHKRNKVLRNGCQLVRSYLDYVDPTYLNKTGRGRMKPKQIQAVVGSVELEGMNVVELRKQVVAEEEARAKELRERWIAAQDAAAQRE